MKSNLTIEGVLGVFGGVLVGFVIAIFIMCLTIEEPIIMQMEFHSGYPPADIPALVVYESGGIITMVSSRRLSDDRLLPFNVYGGPVPYELLEEPAGWTALPTSLLEILE